MTATVYLRVLGLYCELNNTDPKGILGRLLLGARVSIALMAFSDLRSQTLGNYNGSDGLRLGDFPEAEISPEGIEFKKVPTMLIVRKNLSKAKHQYFTFVSQQTIHTLRSIWRRGLRQARG